MFVFDGRTLIAPFFSIWRMPGEEVWDSHVSAGMLCECFQREALTPNPPSRGVLILCHKGSFFGMSDNTVGLMSFTSESGEPVTLRITRPGENVAERSKPSQPIPARVHPVVTICRVPAPQPTFPFLDSITSV